VDLATATTPGALLEREREVRALTEALRQSGDDHGRVVVVEGSAGSGKSSLIAEAVALARNSGIEVLHARGGEMEREHPQGLIRQLFEPVVRRLDPEARNSALSGAAAPAARLLGLDDDPSRFADGFAAMHSIFWLTAGLTSDRALLIAVDDAHWGDVSSLQVLEHLARRIDDLNVTLVVALRPAEPGSPGSLLDALRQVPGAIHLQPTALSVEAVTTVLSARWPQITARACSACREVTGGNPLLVTELLRALPGPEAPTSEAIVSASLPTLEERILRRAAQVAPEAPAVAQAMAVLGDGASLRIAAQLADTDAGLATVLAHKLRRIEILASEDPVRFVHPLVRQSLYDGIPIGERWRLHARASDLLLEHGAPAETAVAHLTVLPPAGSSHVAGLHLQAAESALTRAAPAEAVKWLERAIAEDARAPCRAELLARLGLARATLRDPACVEVLREAYDTLEDPELRCSVAVDLSYALALSGAWERAAELIERADRDLRDFPPAISDLAAIRASLELHDARRCADFDRRRGKLEQIAREGDDWGANAVAAIIGNEAAYRGRIGTAREELALARRGERLLRERGGGGWAMPMVLGLPIIIDDLEQAEELIGEAERAARASGSMLGTLTTISSSAWLRARRGDLIGAEADFTTVLALSQENNIAMMISNIALYLIDVLLERHDAAPAGAAIENTPVPPEYLPTWSGAMLIEARGRLRLARGARAAAIEDLREAGRTASALNFGPVISGWRSALALAIAGDAEEEAVALAETELRLARESGLPRPTGIALRTLGVVHGRRDRGIEYLRESVTVLAAGPSRLEHARSIVALGSALRRGNHAREARSILGAGLDLAVACGAERLSSEAQEELLAAGGRRRRVVAGGVESLTASEHRVARLAADGLSNLEIAQRLFISVKTVETHLAHVYGKCGLAGAGSRWRLGSLLEEGSAAQAAASS
jgi:ATP/maltotriose-dependent transcriptional regulator MalT